MTPCSVGLVAAVTVRAKLGDVTLPFFTVRFVVPAASPATEPLVVTEAIAVLELVQLVAVEVQFCVEASE